MDWEKQIEDVSKKQTQFDLLRHQHFEAFSSLKGMGYPDDIILARMLDIAEGSNLHSPRTIHALFVMWKEEQSASKS